MLAPIRLNFSTLQMQHDHTPSTNELTLDYSPFASPITPDEKRLFPRPLKIIKRPSQKSSTSILARRASLTETPLLARLEDNDNPVVPQPLSMGSTQTLTPPQLEPTPANTVTNLEQFYPLSESSSSIARAIPNCSICSRPLSTLQTYNFPKTAPAIILRVHSIFPSISSAPNFCATCFEAIREMHICWGCGEDVHRQEERVGCGWAWWHWGCVRCLLCRSPLPPPLWTSFPITLSVPPSCKACTRELRELAYHERQRKQAINPVVRAGSGVEMVGARIRKVSLGVKYPPLPKWMDKLPGSRGKGDQGKGVAVKWMEMLPGNRKGLGKAIGRGVGENGRDGESGYGSVRGRIVVGG